MGITPACAGNTFRSHLYTLAKKDHPRLRGEYRKLNKNCRFIGGSPPLARGIRAAYLGVTRHMRITPACAGNTRCSAEVVDSTEDHPRLRGEYSCPVTKLSFKIGSPPLARGIPHTQEPQISIVRITPACAGNTLVPDIESWAA